MPAAKDCHALITYYIKGYEKKYNNTPNVNRYSARWGFDSVLTGMSMQHAKELLDYYFTTSSPRMHDLDWFFYNYEKLVKGMQDDREDGEHIRRLMEESKSRAEQWRQSGKQGITNN